MSPIAHAISEIRHRGRSRGGEIYLTPEAAIDCVRVCEENDVAVVGVEGFILDEASTAPLLDEIADFSELAAVEWASFRQEVNREAVEFIKELPKRVGLNVTLTLLSSEEWRRSR
jgi:hypothetical protein